MADPKLRITHDGVSFDLRGLTAKEMARVKTETGLRNRGEFFDAITDEDPDALIAAFVIARTRAGETVRWSDVDVNLDDVEAGYFDDSDREVEPVFETAGDGSLLLVKRDDDGRVLKDDKGHYIPDPNGTPVGKRDDRGRLIWRYVDGSGDVPPTESVEETSSPATSTEPGESSASVYAIPATSTG